MPVLLIGPFVFSYANSITTHLPPVNGCRRTDLIIRLVVPLSGNPQDTRLEHLVVIQPQRKNDGAAGDGQAHHTRATVCASRMLPSAENAGIEQWDENDIRLARKPACALHPTKPPSFTPTAVHRGAVWLRRASVGLTRHRLCALSSGRLPGAIPPVPLVRLV